MKNADKPLRALLVEDDANLSFLWCEVLQEVGFECETAASCAEATRRILKGAFDLFLLDLLVEDDNTLSLSDWIATRVPGVPIVMLTGSGMFPHGEHTQVARQVSWFLCKPIRPVELGTIVQHLVRTARRQTRCDAALSL